MKPYKKVEIIIETIQQPRILQLLDSLRMPYSIINEVAGRGRGFFHDTKELTDVFTNSYIMILCTDEEAQMLVSRIRPKIATYGGICCISDVSKVIIQS